MSCVYSLVSHKYFFYPQSDQFHSSVGQDSLKHTKFLEFGVCLNKNPDGMKQDLKNSCRNRRSSWCYVRINKVN